MPLEENLEWEPPIDGDEKRDGSLAVIKGEIAPVGEERSSPERGTLRIGSTTQEL